MTGDRLAVSTTRHWAQLVAVFAAAPTPTDAAVEGHPTTALELASAIAGNAPLAVRAARRVLRAAPDLTDAAALQLESHLAAELAATDDAKEGPRAFVEKRSPVFTDH